jgi:hypothetical protein
MKVRGAATTWLVHTAQSELVARRGLGDVVDTATSPVPSSRWRRRGLVSDEDTAELAAAA